MIRPIVLSLAAATTIAITAIAVSRAEQHDDLRPTVWIQFASSAHNGMVQHLTTAWYKAPSLKTAMRECNIDRDKLVIGFETERMIPLLEPICTLDKPRTWID